MRGVIDPELGDDLVDLGMYQGPSDIGADGVVTVHVALTTARCPLRSQLQRDVEARVGSLPGVSRVVVRTSEMSAAQKKDLMARARRRAQDSAPDTEIPGRTRVLAVSSGKGGVGKSSVTVNLAAGLAARGLHGGLARRRHRRLLGAAHVGYGGPPRGRPRRRRQQVADRARHKTVGTGVIKVVSMGFLSPEDEAIMWRGLMLNRGVQHFLEDVAWGDLDYLLVDMPPGTGDVQMGLARMLPRAEMLIVTTPALAAQKVAVRAADMARKGYLRVAGVIENMSGFTCDHGERYELFGSGGGARLAQEIGAPLLACIPLEPAISDGGDRARRPRSTRAGGRRLRRLGGRGDRHRPGRRDAGLHGPDDGRGRGRPGGQRNQLSEAGTALSAGQHRLPIALRQRVGEPVDRRQHPGQEHRQSGARRPAPAVGYVDGRLHHEVPRDAEHHEQLWERGPGPGR